MVGHKLENVVFLNERRRCKDLFYYSNAHEIDLVIESPKQSRFINVTWSYCHPQTLDREMQAMMWGKQHFTEIPGLLVAHETNHLSVENPGFSVLPAWQYLIGGSDS